jgi:glycosyltransferase involved in cell wall biosynthesis
MKLTVVIPCYNEVNTIVEVVKRIKSGPIKNCEIIAVDDCLSDDKREVIQSPLETEVEQVVYHTKNQGKGAALRSCFLAATGDIVIIPRCRFRV